MEGDFGGTSVKVCCPRFIFFWLTLAATLSVAPPAHAHLVNTGFGPFDDGLTHLFVAPEDLLPVIALALLAGLRGPRFGRAVLFALPVAWMAGSTIGLLLAPPITLPLAQTILTIALGLLLATESRLSLAFADVLAILLGLLHGLLNGSELPKASWSSPISVARRWSCALCCSVTLGRTSVRGACPLGACSRPRRWELDRGHRSLDAGLGDARFRLARLTRVRRLAPR